MELAGEYERVEEDEDDDEPVEELRLDHGVYAPTQQVVLVLHVAAQHGGALAVPEVWLVCAATVTAIGGVVALGVVGRLVVVDARSAGGANAIALLVDVLFVEHLGILDDHVTTRRVLASDTCRLARRLRATATASS